MANSVEGPVQRTICPVLVSQVDVTDVADPPAISSV